jgi:DNA-binding CsgD family transcriptional regulator
MVYAKEKPMLLRQGFHEGEGMTHVDAVAVLAGSAAIVGLLVLSDPKDGLVYLLAFPIWLVGRDLGLLAGVAVAAVAIVFVALGAAQGLAPGPMGYAGATLVFFGTGAAGAKAIQPRRRISLPLLRQRPEVGQVSDALSRRELQVLELIATGSNNADIAARFVISENTVKTHVSHILQKLPASNRTEAAFRYIEMYGAPAERMTAASAVKATVAAVAQDEEVALKLQDGRALELPLPEDLSDHVDVGSSAIVYFDPCDRAVGWYLPDDELGVDLRHWVA